jgi:hypothetical protein
MWTNYKLLIINLTSAVLPPGEREQLTEVTITKNKQDQDKIYLAQLFIAGK